MAIRSLVRIALVLAVVGVHVFAAASPPATAQTDTATAPRTQKRLAKQTVLKAGLKGISPWQDASGGFAAPNTTPGDPRATADAVSMMIALRNAGVDVDLDAAVAYLQQTDPVAWIEAQALTMTDSEVAKIVMALVAAGGDPRDVGGVDLVARLVASWDDATGFYGGALWQSPFVIMALVVAGEPYEEQAIETLAAAQLDDGSWAYEGRAPGSGDARMTAWVVQALVAVGRGDDATVADAVAYFPTVQVDDGAFATEPGSTPDAWTSGFVISALIAAGEDLKAEEWATAVSGLLAFQNEDGTFKQYPEKPEVHFDATIVALIALAGAYWPVLPTA